MKGFVVDLRDLNRSKANVSREEVEEKESAW